MKHVNIGLGALIILGVILAVIQPAALPTQAAVEVQPTPQAKYPQQDAALREAFSAAIQGREDVLGFIVYDTEVQRIEYSQDGQTALLFLQMRDRTTGKVIATEPGLAIAQLNSLSDGSKALDWKITLQADSNWEEQLNNLPAGMLTEEGRLLYMPDATPVTETLPTPIRGYKLPWAKGLTKQLSGSIGHFLIYYSCAAGETACRYAYDFADGTMFPLLAARGGLVHLLYDECPNDNHSCVNYIVLEDRSTSPYTYQLYMHIAYHSIPQNLRTINTPVVQGQFIANVDNTGYSTGSHLHFHVHTNPSSYWGNSVDIAFDEVPFNDGEPRTCYEAEHWPAYGTGCADTYTSQNQGANPPTGNLTQPTNGQVFSTSIIPMAGTATDDISITKIQPVVYNGSEWVEVGSSYTTASFNGTVDLCSANIADGPVLVGFYAYDYEGNRSTNVLGQRQIFKSATCSTPAPPACVPTSSQVALFTGVDYTGVCKKFNIGNYTSDNLYPLQMNQTVSILVGSNVTVTGYDGEYDTTYVKFDGRGETYYSSDPNLADNLLPANAITSIRVQAKSSGPLDIFTDPIGLTVGQSPTSVDSLILSAIRGNYYKNGDGVNTWSATLAGPGGTLTLPTQKYPIWSVGSLAAGSYTFTVTAQGSSATKQASTSFTVSEASLPAVANRSVPYLDEMEAGINDWTASGLWHQMPFQRDSATTTAWGYNNGTDYSTATYRGGDLTSPPITLPAGGAYLRFDYLYKTETANPLVDQRRVQISVNGGAFTDLLQMSDDPMDYWLHSPVINLTGAQYRGQTVRIRFHFDTVDIYGNGFFPGWLVDNVSLNTTAPDLSCAETTPNDTPATASSIAINSDQNGVICTGGDVDYYKVNASAGMRLIASVAAAANGSPLDSVLRLYDSDGRSVLVENDDVSSTLQDSQLNYTVQRSGTYYLRVSAWDHPSAGSPQHTYTLSLRQDVVQPVVVLNFPTSRWIPGPIFPVIANVSDPGGSGPGAVDVYFHSTDWTNGLWEKITSDTTPEDGFYIPVDLSAKGADGGSLLVQGFDLTGTSAIALVSPLGVDATQPTASFESIPPNGSTRFLVRWNLADTISGLAGFSIQVQVDGGSWTDWMTAPDLNLRQAWYQGELGHTYGFRLQAVDVAGNVRVYPASAEVSISVSTCTADAFEDADDSPTSANLLGMESSPQHNFCAANDVDWFTLQAADDQPLLLVVQPSAAMGAYTIGWYDASGQTLLQEITSNGGGIPAALPIVPASGGGTYRVRIQPLDPRLAGDGVTYTLQLFQAVQVHLPLVQR